MQFKQKISEELFKQKYCLHNEMDIESVFMGVAEEISSVEIDYSKKKTLQDEFCTAMKEGKFIPGGRILANARPNSPMKNYNNCFVLPIEDSMECIYQTLKEDSLVGKMGGGVGLNVSSLRPKGAPIKTGGVSSGVMSFLEVFNTSAKAIHTGGGRRCLPYDAKVFTKHAIKNIEDVSIGDEVLTSDGYAKVSNYFVQGKQETIVIKTRQGDFECTPNHKMPVYTSLNEYAWKQASELAPGDRLVYVGTGLEGTATELPEWNYERPSHSTTCRDIAIPALTTDVAWLFGYLFGNGHIRLNKQKSKGNVSASCPDKLPKIIEKVKETLSLFGTNVVVKEGKGRCKIIATESKQLALYMSQWKLPNSPLNIPEFIMQGLSEIKYAFIAGLFDADGSSRTSPLRAVTTVYASLSDDLQLLLNSVGIPSSLKVTDRGHIENWKDLYKVDISNAVSAKKWDANIAEYSLKYTTIRNKIYKAGHNDLGWKTEMVLSSPPSGLFKHWARNCNQLSVLTYDRITGKNSHLYPIEVLSIEKGRFVETYDIEVFNKHEFVVNGFLTHNSAHLAALNIDHPEIENFITYKNTEGKLDQFNISVGITNKFMEAVQSDSDWDLVFDGHVYKTVKARYLYDLLTENMFMHNEPGVLFLDRVNEFNKGDYTITATNPCFTGDMELLTSNGYKTFEELNGTQPYIAGADNNFTKGKVWCSGIKPTIKLHLSDKKTITCTSDHKFLINDEWIEARALIGKKLTSNALSVKEKAPMVLRITDNGMQKVYDFTEPNTNAGWVNGVCAHNCGEQPIPPYSSCCLGAVNLSSFIERPFTDEASFNYEKFFHTVHLGIRFLDNVLDMSEYPLDKIKEKVLNERRIGLGITGLADMLVMMNMKYGSQESLEFTDTIMRHLFTESYKASIELAKEKGAFPDWNPIMLENATFSKLCLNKDHSEMLRAYGMRNIACNTIAPTGTTSLTVGQNCSSGVEPIFSLKYDRRIRKDDGEVIQTVYDNAYLLFKELFPEKEIPDTFVTTSDLTVEQHVAMQSVCQEYIDASISKTINLPPGYDKESYKNLIVTAWEYGLKGCTTYNPDGVMQGILGASKKRYSKKRPLELECDIYEMQVNKQRVVSLVGLLDGVPYEIFITDDVDKHIKLSGRKKGVIRKIKSGRYDLILDDECIIEDIGMVFNHEWGALGRMISTQLRHGIPIQFTIEQLNKTKAFGTFSKGVARLLKKYMEVVVERQETCPTCGGDMVNEGGCVICKSCGFSKCE
jgi:ribonucleotide reductase alpha subunit